jgi:hypothetical protein
VLVGKGELKRLELIFISSQSLSRSRSDTASSCIIKDVLGTGKTVAKPPFTKGATVGNCA